MRTFSERHVIVPQPDRARRARTAITAAGVLVSVTFAPAAAQTVRLEDVVSGSLSSSMLRYGKTSRRLQML